MQGWHLVETETPKYYTRVLIYPGTVVHVSLGFWASSGRWFDVDQDAGQPMAKPPTHWMPLPETP